MAPVAAMGDGDVAAGGPRLASGGLPEAELRPLCPRRAPEAAKQAKEWAAASARNLARRLRRARRVLVGSSMRLRERVEALSAALAEHARLDGVAGRHHHQMGMALAAAAASLTPEEIRCSREVKRLGDLARHAPFEEEWCAARPRARESTLLVEGAGHGTVVYALKPDDDLAEDNFFPTLPVEADEEEYVTGDEGSEGGTDGVFSERYGADMDVGEVESKDELQNGYDAGWDERLADVHRQSREYSVFFGYWKAAAATRLKCARRRIAARARRSRKKLEVQRAKDEQEAEVMQILGFGIPDLVRALAEVGTEGRSSMMTQLQAQYVGLGLSPTTARMHLEQAAEAADDAATCESYGVCTAGMDVGAMAMDTMD